METRRGGPQSPPCRFVMIRAVRRVFLLFFFGCWLMNAGPLEDAVGTLSKKISARLAPAETVRLTVRNSSSLPGPEAGKIQPALARALQRRVREPKPVDVAVTISETLRGYILVAEIKRENDTQVEMAEFRPAAGAAPAHAMLTLETKLVWEQDAPILDLVMSGEQMFVLDTSGVSLYSRDHGKWQKTASAPMITNVRDPRGLIEVSAQMLAFRRPGVICTAPLTLASPIACEEGGPFKPANNTQDLHDWRGQFFASAEIGGDTVVAEADGRTRVYDEAHTPQSVFENWGSDFAVLASCGGRHFAASSAGDRHSADSIAVYDLVNRAPVRVSEPVAFAGPVTALRPANDGALAIAQNLLSGKYAAYSLALDCSR